MTRQKRLEKLVTEFWKAGTGIASDRERFEQSQRDIACYVAINIDRIAIASGR